MKLFKIPEFLSIEECDVIYNRILETEEFVKSLGEDIHNGTAENLSLYTSPSPRDRTRSRMPSSA